VKVAVASQYYPPEPVPIPGDVARWLRAAGHEVVVVTGTPNYPTGTVLPGYASTTTSTRREEEVVVHRLPIFASHSRNPIARARNYLSYARHARRSADLVAGADVVYVYATQMTAAIGPRSWRSRGGPPYVLHIQDLWPDSVVSTALLPRILARLVGRALTPWLLRMYEGSAAIVVSSSSMATALKERGVPAQKISTVLNWAGGDNPSAVPDSTPRAGLSLLYAGNIGAAQDLPTVAAAMESLRDLDVRLDVFGDGIGAERFRRLAGGIPSIEVHGVVAPDEIRQRYGAAHFQLVTLRDEPVFRMTMPSKVAAGLAAGIPLITNVAGDVADLVERYGVGLACEPGDPVALAAAIRRAAELTRSERTAMRGKARRLYEERMSREAGLGRIVDVLGDAAGVA
jgi:glycosyltransferase involved in cell wall biosynthesis